jgi:hypothetical protein
VRPRVISQQVAQKLSVVNNFRVGAWAISGELLAPPLLIHPMLTILKLYKGQQAVFLSGAESECLRPERVNLIFSVLLV